MATSGEDLKKNRVAFWVLTYILGRSVISNDADSIKGFSFGSKDYTKELKTVECTSFLGRAS